ncbi:MAG: hypothetical protein LLH30_09985 [Candidatus Manganitrophus sp. SA1]|nr:hypothetical protein [Candidatus Manganitrophus morganii]
MASKRYSKPERLSDVLALIQVLALDQYTHRSESGLQKELQGLPRSSDNWSTVALEHPEFFRVDPKKELPISLVARHVALVVNGERAELDANFISKLLEAAIHLHDREVNRRAAWRSAWPTLLAVLLGGSLTFVGSYFLAELQIQNQVDIQMAQNAREVYSRLMGRKFVTKQLYVSRYEALIFSDYHEARWKLAGSPKDSLDMKETQRWMHRSEDLVFEIVKNNQALFEDLGVVRASFADTTQLRKLVDRLWQLKALKTSEPPDGADTAALRRWKEDAVRQLQAVVDSDYGQPFDDLLNYLLERLMAR